MEFDQSALFYKVYTSEFDMPGGEPFGVMICNFNVSHKSAADLRALRRMSAIAEAGFCSLLFPAPAEMFGMDSFNDLHPSTSVRQIFNSDEYRLWNAFRREPSCRFLGFLLPRVMLRKPWALHTYRRGAFPYRESCTQQSQVLWGHPGFALAKILLREFEEVGWFAHIRGAPRDTLSGGVVAGFLPDLPVDPDESLFSVLPVTEAVITDSLERDFSENGFITLVQCWQTPYSAFFSLPSVFAVEDKTSREATTNIKIGSQVQNVLCASRFAHYIKVMMRDKVGSFFTAGECEEFLQEWLMKYCISGANLDWSTKARYPLRDSKVSVSEQPMSPGSYTCEILISPHYQYDGLVGEIRLTTELSRTQGNAA